MTLRCPLCSQGCVIGPGERGYCGLCVYRTTDKSGSHSPRAFLEAHAGWLHWLGPAVYLAFIALMIVVDYARPVEFRTPQRPAILIPYLVLFFGAILLMGLPMFRLNRRMWLVTAATTALLLGSMAIAMRRGVG